MDSKNSKVVKLYHKIKEKTSENLEVFITKEGKTRRKYDSALDKYFALMTIDERMYRAGKQLYEDAYIGGVLSTIKGLDTTKFMVAGTGTSYRYHEMGWLKADKHKSFSDAMFDKNLGQVGRDILWHTVIFDNDLYSFNKSTQVTKFIFREALDQLARHYEKRKHDNNIK